MKLLLFTRRRMLAVVVAFTLAVAVFTLPTIAAAGNLEVTVFQNGVTKFTTVADTSTGRTVIQMTNTSTGVTSTQVVQANGSSTTTCNGPDKKPIPCP